MKNRKRKGNRIEIVGQVAYVYASNKSDKCFIIDAHNVEKVRPYTWYYDKNGYGVAEIYPNGQRVHIYMHRLIMNVLEDDREIDHINHCRNDNRETNLRICDDEAPNQANKKIFFYNHEQIYIERTRDDKYVMTVGNGIYNDIKILYPSFQQLLKDRQFFYENGLDVIGIYLRNIENQCREQLKHLDVNSEEYKHCLATIRYIEGKHAEAQANMNEINKIMNELKEKGIELGDTPFLYTKENGGVVILFPNPQKSKDVAGTERATFRFLGKY